MNPLQAGYLDQLARTALAPDSREEFIMEQARRGQAITPLQSEMIGLQAGGGIQNARYKVFGEPPPKREKTFRGELQSDINKWLADVDL